MDNKSSKLYCDELNLKPDDLVSEINETECENLGATSGLDGNQRDNCDDLNEMVCAIKQDVDAIATERAMVIAPNDASKCQDDDDPTLASFWSRVLRFSQAITCILCEYDPFIATLLKSGKYPQILMGAVGNNGYPQWVNPDEVPTLGSSKPVMSGGVVQTIKEALLSVWHLWEEYPEFKWFAQTLNDGDDYRNLLEQSKTETPIEGDTALVGFDGTDHNVLYTYKNGQWTKTKVFGKNDGLVNFAVTHIVRGAYADKGVYYFHDGNTDTWQVMDVDAGDLDEKLNELLAAFNKAVQSPSYDEQYILTTRPTAAEAHAVPCDPNKTTIVLITG